MSITFGKANYRASRLYILFVGYVCSLGIEPTPFGWLTQPIERQKRQLILFGADEWWFIVCDVILCWCFSVRESPSSRDLSLVHCSTHIHCFCLWLRDGWESCGRRCMKSIAHLRIDNRRITSRLFLWGWWVSFRFLRSLHITLYGVLSCYALKTWATSVHTAKYGLHHVFYRWRNYNESSFALFSRVGM